MPGRSQARKPRVDLRSPEACCAPRDRGIARALTPPVFASSRCTDFAEHPTAAAAPANVSPAWIRRPSSARSEDARRCEGPEPRPIAQHLPTNRTIAVRRGCCVHSLRPPPVSRTPWIARKCSRSVSWQNESVGRLATSRRLSSGFGRAGGGSVRSSARTGRRRQRCAAG